MTTDQPAPELTDAEQELAVGIVLGCAADMIANGTDATDNPAVRAMWPEALSADALTFATMAAVALATMLDLSPEQIAACAAALVPSE